MRRRAARCASLFAAAIASSGWASPSAGPAPVAAVAPSGNGTSETLRVDGVARSFVRYRPGPNPPHRRPVLLVFHGGGGSGAAMAKAVDFRAIADADDVLLVYPDGLRRGWNDGRANPAGRDGIDDVGFVAALIDRLVDDGDADPARVYAVGLSNGGFLASRLACTSGTRLAAVAVVAASIGAPTVAAGCAPARPLPILFLQGTADPIVPFAGGTVAGDRGVAIGHDDAVARWLAIDRCDAVTERTTIPDGVGDGTSVRVAIHRHCAGGSAVADYVVDGGGHVWPGGRSLLPAWLVGPTTGNLEARDAVWRFVSEFRRSD